MTYNKPYIKFTALFVVLLCPALTYFALTTGRNTFLHLKIFGPRLVSEVVINGQGQFDTVFHTISDFQFLNPQDKTVSNNIMEGKIAIVNYFPIVDAALCLKTSTQMKRIFEKLSGMDDFMILSIVIAPENENTVRLGLAALSTSRSPQAEMLQKQVYEFGNSDEKWQFLTGEKEAIYKFANEGCLLSELANNQKASLALGERDFFYGEQFVLFDKSGRIRGYYKGTDFSEANRMMDEIKVLKAEEMIPRKN